MNKYRFFTIILLFISIIFLQNCDKRRNEWRYGVSISAPKMLGTADEVFSKDNIRVFRMVNSLNFSLLNQPRGIFDSSFLFSPASVLEAFYSLDDQTYISILKDKFNVTDTLDLYSNFSTIRKLCSEIDSTLKNTNEITINNNKEIFIKQEIEFPLVTGEVYSKKILPFYTQNQEQEMEFFSIQGEMGMFSDKNLNVFDISIGNGNYSLLIIYPKNHDVKNLTDFFTESDYKINVESLVTQVGNITFPNISDKNNYSIFLSFPVLDLNSRAMSTTINSSINIIEPTLAEISIKKENLDRTIINKTKSESFLIDHPFLYFIRDRHSNFIIATGLFCGIGKSASRQPTFTFPNGSIGFPKSLF
ncbi:MAG: hypothetical protein LBM25_06740 [Bacteroidales bacterium]|jgi:hypothetical protein|nr:hypothetical protein [Bacteroidales bacterium]